MGQCSHPTYLTDKEEVVVEIQWKGSRVHVEIWNALESRHMNEAICYTYKNVGISHWSTDTLFAERLAAMTLIPLHVFG